MTNKNKYFVRSRISEAEFREIIRSRQDALYPLPKKRHLQKKTEEVCREPQKEVISKKKRKRYVRDLKKR